MTVRIFLAAACGPLAAGAAQRAFVIDLQTADGKVRCHGFCMTFLSVFAALILEHYLSWRRRDRMAQPFLRWCDTLRELLDSGLARHGTLAWVLAVGPALVGGALCSLVAGWLGGPALAALVNVAVLVTVIDFRSLPDHLAVIGTDLRAEHLESAIESVERWEGRSLPGEFDLPGIASRAIELALLQAHWRVLTPILWFVVLPGVSGPLGYAAARVAERQWRPLAAEGSAFPWFAGQALRVLDWLPARLTALAFAVVGNFEESVYCWRNQTRGIPHDDARIVLAAGAGAIGVHFEATPELPFDVANGDLGTGDLPGPEHLQNAEGLLARTVVFAVVTLGVLTLAGLLGGA